VVQSGDVGRRTFRIGARGCLVVRYTAVAGTGTLTDPLRFELRRGNRLTVQVHPGAFRLDGLMLTLRSPERIYTESSVSGTLLRNIHLASGHYRFEGLPAKSTTFTTEISGRKFERSVRPDSKSRVEIQVPRLVRIRPQFPSGLDTRFIELELQDTEHPARRLRLQFNLRDSGRWLPT
jgi:hypothetical protein